MKMIFATILFFGNVLAAKFPSCVEPKEGGNYFLRVIKDDVYEALKITDITVDPFKEFGKAGVLTFGNGQNADLKSKEEIEMKQKKEPKQDVEDVMRVRVEYQNDNLTKFRLKTWGQKTEKGSMYLSVNSKRFSPSHRFYWYSNDYSKDQGDNVWFSYSKDEMRMSFEGEAAKGYSKGEIGSNGSALYPKDNKKSQKAMFCFQNEFQTKEKIEPEVEPIIGHTEPFITNSRSNSNDNPVDVHLVDVPATEEDIEKLIRKWAEEEIEEFKKLEEDEKKEVVKKGQELEVLKLLKDQKLALSAFEKEKEAVVPELRKFVDELPVKDSGASEFAVFAVISLATLLF